MIWFKNHGWESSKQHWLLVQAWMSGCKWQMQMSKLWQKHAESLWKWSKRKMNGSRKKLKRKMQQRPQQHKLIKIYWRRENNQQTHCQRDQVDLEIFVSKICNRREICRIQQQPESTYMSTKICDQFQEHNHMGERDGQTCSHDWHSQPAGHL